MSSVTNIKPKLQPPGAGLPFFEHLVLKYYYGSWVSKKYTKEQNLLRFLRINQKMLNLSNKLSLKQMHKKVLIPRLPSIEDSSRFWSVSDTLEHIEIVGEKVATLIETLSRDKLPIDTISIAGVKPTGKYNESDPRPAFEHFTQKTYDRVKDLNVDSCSLLFRHPWMGKLCPLQWTWVLGGHSAVHLNQINHIVKGL